MTDDDVRSIGNVAAAASVAGKFIIVRQVCATAEACRVLLTKLW